MLLLLLGSCITMIERGREREREPFQINRDKEGERERLISWVLNFRICHNSLLLLSHSL